MIKNYESISDRISDRIRIYVDDKNKKYNIVDMKSDTTIFFHIKDLDTAIEIKKAYCFGYIDRKNEEQNYD